MMAWKWVTAMAAAVLSASALTYDTTIQSVDSVSEWQMLSNFVVDISVPGSDIETQQYSVIPLAPILGYNKTQMTQTPGTLDLTGDLILATVTSYVGIAGTGKIALLSCDNVSSSFIDDNTMFNALLSQQPVAILLYSESNNGCSLSAGSDLTYYRILTLVNRNDAAQAVNLTQTSTVTVQAEIKGNSSSQASSDGTATSGNNSAIAMNVLYSITGLVTILFLIIIATGAVRAHRNPERYGPRSGNGGRPRQSRAKGLARAVLETLPIVKFGDANPAKPDPTTELESIAESRLDRTVDHDAATLTAIPENAAAAPKSKAANDPEAKVTSVNAVGSADATLKETESGIGKASTAPATQDPAAADDGDHLGCSICTEDFSVGEDVRVLPCNHKFHPHCVDPWLVNVSGTCPLCRLDLRPNTDEDESTAVDGQLPMPPPLEDDVAQPAQHTQPAQPAEAESAGRRRSRLFDLTRLRHAPVEERIAALRRYRAENQAEGPGPAATPSSAAAGGLDQHSRDTLTKRLRDKFRIRTRAQSPSRS